jgi:hypothetical protein
MKANPPDNSDNHTARPPDISAHDLAADLTVEDFLALGADSTAFVKAVEIEGKPAYGIFSALGHPLGFAESLAVAQATVRQNDLEPFSVH